MLSLPIYGPESYDEVNDRFTHAELFRLELQHSLVSLSKWEAKFEKPFLGDGEKTDEELLWYIEAMHQGPELPADFAVHMTQSDFQKVNDYLNAKNTATWFSSLEDDKTKQEVITAEIIYYWLVSLNVPFEVEHWHLNRLMTLIRVINEKNAPPKKLTREQIIERNRRLNEERQRKYNTTG